MRHLLICIVGGIFIAGVGERVVKRLHATSNPAGQTSAASAGAGSRDAPARSTKGPQGVAAAGPGKLRLRADRDGHFRVSAMVNGRR